MAKLLESASLTFLAVVQLAINMLSRPFHILQACCGILSAVTGQTCSSTYSSLVQNSGLAAAAAAEQACTYLETRPLS